jgi:poly(beta-D-mannuronate) lyase
VKRSPAWHHLVADIKGQRERLYRMDHPQDPWRVGMGDPCRDKEAEDNAGVKRPRLLSSRSSGGTFRTTCRRPGKAESREGNRMRRFQGLAGLLLGVLLELPGYAATFHAADASEVKALMSRLRPGDELVLAVGEWKDAELHLHGQGTAEAPIRVRPAEPGELTLSGASRIRLSGEYLEVSGMRLRNITGHRADWIEFRYDSKQLARHCCVRDCRLSEDDSFAPRESENRWVSLYGSHNQVSHCVIEGKKNGGATLVVWLGDANFGTHRIVHNHFGKRPRLGKNGGETIRVGDSKTSMQSANCYIGQNLFERCDGEAECISNKSCNNVYQSNVFLEVQGTLTLRHGNACLVRDNIFLGNERPQTGGVRIIGEDHQVINNFFADLEGNGFRSAITLVRGLPDSPLHGYFPVKRVTIEGNTLVNCKHNLLLAYAEDPDAVIEPEQVVIRQQRIVARPGREVFESPGSTIQAIQWQGNLVQADRLGIELIPGVEVVSRLEVANRPKIDKSHFGPKWLKHSRQH